MPYAPSRPKQDTLPADYLVYARSFERTLLAENKSPRTVRTYGEAVRLLGEYLAAHGMPTAVTNITREHLEAFLGDQLVRHKAASANNRFRGLQRFFKWLADEGERRDSPMANTRPPHVSETPPDVLTEDQIRRLLRTCEGRTFERRRDTALMRLLLDREVRLRHRHASGRVHWPSSG